jgi:hypothetical protein
MRALRRMRIPNPVLNRTMRRRRKGKRRERKERRRWKKKEEEDMKKDGSTKWDKTEWLTDPMNNVRIRPHFHEPIR